MLAGSNNTEFVVVGRPQLSLRLEVVDKRLSRRSHRLRVIRVLNHCLIENVRRPRDMVPATLELDS